MTDTASPKYSTLPASAVLLVVFLIASMVVTLVIPGGLFLVLIWFSVVILWAAKLLYDLVRWVRADKIERPKMRFPKKSVLALFVVVLCVGYFGFLLVTEDPF